jgi:glycerol-3-phosphate dehydrogenase (NAD(P)+)
MVKKTTLGRATRASTISDDSIGIVGTGAFGTALASVIAAHDKAAVLFASSRETRDEINIHHRNAARLPGVSLAKRVAATSDPEEIAKLCRTIILAVPSPRIEAVIEQLAPHLSKDHIVCHAVGGLVGGQRRVSQVIDEKAPWAKVAALAGPALPRDLCARRSSALVVASKSDEVLATVKRALHYPPTLRIYKNRDLLGVELASAISSALTVVIGVADGFGVGEGPRTVLITRSVAEGARIGAASGARERTFFGMAGLGNLLVRISPSSRHHSRDYQLGLAVGRGETPPAEVTEGGRALTTMVRLAELLDIEAPICTMIDRTVRGEASPELAADRLASWETDLE